MQKELNQRLKDIAITTGLSSQLKSWKPNLDSGRSLPTAYFFVSFWVGFTSGKWILDRGAKKVDMWSPFSFRILLSSLATRSLNLSRGVVWRVYKDFGIHLIKGKLRIGGARTLLATTTVPSRRIPRYSIWLVISACSFFPSCLLLTCAIVCATRTCSMRKPHPK